MTLCSCSFRTWILLSFFVFTWWRVFCFVVECLMIKQNPVCLLCHVLFKDYENFLCSILFSRISTFFKDFIMNELHCMQLNNSLSSQKQCIDLGGNLVSIHNQLTLNFLKTFLKKYANIIPRTWIGAHDATMVTDFSFPLNINPASVRLM